MYADDLLAITRGSLENHLDKLRKVLIRLRDAGPKECNKIALLCRRRIYLGYILVTGGIETLPKKVETMLAIKTT